MASTRLSTRRVTKKPPAMPSTTTIAIDQLAGADDDVVQPLALLEIAADQQPESAGKLQHAHQRVMLGRAVAVVDAAVGGLGPARLVEHAGRSASRHCR